MIELFARRERNTNTGIRLELSPAWMRLLRCGFVSQMDWT
jgi:hypothetical protein